MNTDVRSFTRSWLSGASPKAGYPDFHPEVAIPGVNEGAGQGQGACDMTAGYSTIISPGRLVWRNCSAVAGGQEFRVAGQLRHAENRGVISQLSPSSPQWDDLGSSCSKCSPR